MSDEEGLRKAFEAGRSTVHVSEHCEHFGIFNVDWDWQWRDFEHWQKSQEAEGSETARKMLKRHFRNHIKQAINSRREG